MTFTLHAPQAIWLAMTVVGLVLIARDHGKARPPQNFWIHLFAVAISFGLLLWGGFFR